MRRTLLLIVCVLLLTSCKRLVTAVSFEGEIDMRMSISLLPGSGSTTTYEVKGDRIRSESKSLGFKLSITDMGAKKTWLIDSKTKSYSEVDLSALATAAKTTPKPPAKVTKTARSDRVAGYSCDVYTMDDPGASLQAEACLASGFSVLAFGITNPLKSLSKDDDAWSELMSKGFPLRIAFFDTAGKPTMTFEATRIERKSLPDADFQLPAGYTKRAI